MAANCWYSSTCRLAYKEMFWTYFGQYHYFGGRFLFNSLISVRSHLLAALCMEGEDLGRDSPKGWVAACAYQPGHTSQLSPIFFSTRLWMPSIMHTLLWLISLGEVTEMGESCFWDLFFLQTHSSHHQEPSLTLLPFTSHLLTTFQGGCIPQSQPAPRTHVHPDRHP